jgi:hypothetical protein
VIIDGYSLDVGLNGACAHGRTDPFSNGIGIMP